MSPPALPILADLGPAIAFLAGVGGWAVASLFTPAGSRRPTWMPAAANDNERFVTRPYLP